MAHVHPLVAFRKAQHPPLSQEELAGLLKVTRTTVARWETGRRKIDEDRLANVARVTGIPTYVLRPDLARLMAAAHPGAAA